MKQDQVIMLVVAFLLGLFFKQIAGQICGGRLVEGAGDKPIMDTGAGDPAIKDTGEGYPPITCPAWEDIYSRQGSAVSNRNLLWTVMYPTSKEYYLKDFLNCYHLGSEGVPAYNTYGVTLDTGWGLGAEG